IVPPSEVKRAQRILQQAKVEAEWGKAPSADEVRARDDARMLENPALTAPAGEEADSAAALLEWFGPEQVAAAFIRLWREGRPAPEDLMDLPAAGAAVAPKGPRPEFGASVWYSLTVGHSGRA